MLRRFAPRNDDRGCSCASLFRDDKLPPVPEDRRAHADMRGAKLDRGGVIRAHAHREILQSVAGGDLGGQREMRRRRLIHRRDAHQAGYLQPIGVATGGDEGVGFAGRDARPLLGFGWDSFATAEAPYLIQPSTYPLTAAGRFIHNTFLSNAVELGVIGALLWLIALGAALISPLLHRGPPAWRSSLVAVAGFWAVTAWFYPLPLTFPLTFLMLWAGLVDSTGSRVTQREGLFPYPSRARSAALDRPAITEGAR